MKLFFSWSTASLQSWFRSSSSTELPTSPVTKFFLISICVSLPSTWEIQSFLSKPKSLSAPRKSCRSLWRLWRYRQTVSVLRAIRVNYLGSNLIGMYLDCCFLSSGHSCSDQFESQRDTLQAGCGFRWRWHVYLQVAWLCRSQSDFVHLQQSHHGNCCPHTLFEYNKGALADRLHLQCNLVVAYSRRRYLFRRTRRS